MKIPFDDMESFFSHSALYYHQIILNGGSTDRLSYIKRLVAHSKRLGNNQCPRVAEFCKTVRQYGKKGLWIYDQYFQMIIGAKPAPNCYPLNSAIVEKYAEATYTNDKDKEQFIKLRLEQCGQ